MKNKQDNKDNVTAINDSVEMPQAQPQPLTDEQLKAIAYDYMIDIEQKTAVVRQIQTELANRAALTQSN